MNVCNDVLCYIQIVHGQSYWELVSLGLYSSAQTSLSELFSVRLFRHLIYLVILWAD